MKKQLFLLSVVLLGAMLTLTNCKKETTTNTTVTPVSDSLFCDFSINKQVTLPNTCGGFDAGLVRFDNLAANATVITWFFGDGDELVNKQSYITHQYRQKGNYTVRQVATNAKGTKSRERIVTVLGEGCVIFYSSNANALFPLTINCGGQQKTIREYEVTCANCCTSAGQYGTSIASFNLVSGNYPYTVKNKYNTTIATGSASVAMGQCNTRSL